MASVSFIWIEAARFINSVYYTEILVQISTSSHEFRDRNQTEITKGIYY